MNILLILLYFSLPQTISVRVTGLSECQENMTWHSEVILFKDYVKGVLPNEWYPSWNEESLKAGAVAVKMFALADMKSGYVWDCNWDQVYDPTRRTPQTDKAVDDTWNYILYPLTKTYHDSRYWICYDRGLVGQCAGQVETQTDAANGLKWQNIVMKYYEGKLLNLDYSPPSRLGGDRED